MVERYSPYKIIFKPIITEKSTAASTESNTYTFKVDKNANKVQIRKAVEEIFDVEVARVRTLKVHGKKRRVRYKIGHRPDWKKALVTLKEGYIIDFI